MKNWLRVVAAAAVILAAGVPAEYAARAHAAYQWIPNPTNGHSYAITDNYSDWVGAEAEAVAAGGHLATVNDAAENAWLSTAFKGYYARDYQGNPSASLVWIGLYQPPVAYHPYDPARPTDFQWVSGEPVNPAYSFPIYGGNWSPPSGPGGDGGNHVYLHTDTHPVPGTWWNGNGADIDTSSQPRGIIEVPEPSTFVLLGMGALALFACAWGRKRTA